MTETQQEQQAMDPHATDHTSVESVLTEPIRRGYEFTRDNLDHREARENWQGAHAALDAYRQACEEIDAMEEYTDEAKLERKVAAYQKHIPQVAQGFEQARQIVEETA